MTGLSVIGEKGDKGPRGAIGKQGKTGNPGERGELIVDHIFIVKVEELENNINLVIDDISKKEITLYRGHSYIFDQSHQSNLDSNDNLRYRIALWYDNQSFAGDEKHYITLTGDSNHKNMFEVPNDMQDSLYYIISGIPNSGGKIILKTLLPDYNYVSFTIEIPENTNKADLENDNQSVIGMSSKYTVSGGDILNGQPLIQDFTNNTISATGISDVPPAWKFIGIATNSATSGNDCTVVHDGFVTARFGSSSFETWKFDSSIVNNTVNLTKELKFTHGSPDMSGLVHYTITFDAGEGKTIHYTINNLYFGHTSSTLLNPRLGWQYSNNNDEYTTPKLEGWIRSRSSIPPGNSRYYMLSEYSDVSGYIFPNSIQRIKDLNGSLTGTFGSRYIKFFYYCSYDISDGNAEWDITLSTDTTVSQYIVPPEIDTPLYLNPYDFTTLTTISSGTIVGYCANKDISNNSIYMRVSTNM